MAFYVSESLVAQCLYRNLKQKSEGIEFLKNKIETSAVSKSSDLFLGYVFKASIQVNLSMSGKPVQGVRGL